MSDYQFQPMKLGMYDSRFERDACGIGMLVNIEGKQSHGLVDDAIEVLINMTHRGGVGAEPETGDGAGIMTQIPHNFFKRVMECMDVELPEPGEYAIAMMFGSPEQKGLQMTTERFVGVFEDENLEVLGVRSVPVHYDFIGDTARKLCPGIRQIFIKKPAEMTEIEFERKLYIVSKLAHNAIRPKDVYFYLSSISSRTIVYKGMLRPDQLSGFYLDLQDVDFASAIALVHSRFSTNTFPSWERAHPMSYIIHNGEINTIRGNVNWVRAREASFKSDYFGEELERVFPVINEEGSDSAMLDDFVKLLVHSGYSLPQAVMMAVPEPWENNADMDDTKKAFYEFNSTLMEPWDGPAAIAFTDGKIAGATLDRNGLRPSRYYLMDDNTLILASEVGVLKLPQERVVKKDRLRPGRMLLIDTEEGRIIEDKELKHNIATALPYREWLDQYLTELDNLHFSDKIGISWSDVVTGIKSGSDNPKEQALLKTISSLEVSNVTSASGFYTDEFNLVQEQKLFGYTYEDINLTLKEIAEKHDDPISSMGIDTPLAVLSNKPQLLYNYFKQLFAQVTNPPIDAIREKIVTSSNIQLGTEGNLLEPAAVRCQMIRHSTPILTIDDLSKLKGIDLDGYQSVTLPITFKRRKEDALKKALDDLFIAAEIVMEQGYNILILSDLGADEENVPIPALLATSALHHYLVKNGTRTKVSLVVETGEAREAHHMATLVGYGANAVCPVLAYKSLESMADTGWIDVDKKTALRNYQQTMTKAIVKIMSKMGISTVRSYHGAQVFEALGVSEACVEEYFTGTISRIEGIELTEMEQEARARHRNAFDNKNDDGTLDPGGDYKWRKDGEYHLFNPENIYYLQQSCRTGNYDMFKTFSKLVNKRTVELKNIRGLLEIVEADKPISIETVESAESIVKRFKTGAMSYGSISKKAHETMAIAMNRLGAKSNTGEGGEESERFTPDANGDNRCSAIKQVASGRFGVTIDYLNNAKEIQIKMAQGAKPGEGGHLPGMKVYPWIAKSRYSTPGVELISPPPHHDIYSIEDLAQLIRDLKSANPDARISVKLVSEGGVGTIAVGVSKALADVIVVSGYDGGTGAAPRTSVRHAGLPWELGVAEAHQSLLMNNMRNRVVLETDGKLLTGRDIIIAALLGAEEFAFATGPLVVMGCDMMRVCNLDTCPVGIATQNPTLCSKFEGKPEHVENFMLFLAEEVREWMARIGVTDFNELIGHAELLRQIITEKDKAYTVVLDRLLYQPKIFDTEGSRYFTKPQDHALEQSIDMKTLIPLCREAIENPGEKAAYRFEIKNTDRTVGATLSSAIAKKHGAVGLPEGSIHIRFDGSSGQSFGSFLAPGVELELHGDANDYLGKGLSGGRITIVPPDEATFTPSENVIAGNTALYGATMGECYIAGKAGERFAVRNSGATAVVEGVGDHGCEYMTGGRVVILGRTGINFGAGMSGGIAYVLDEEGIFTSRCSGEKLTLGGIDKEGKKELKALLEAHVKYTDSAKGRAILGDFEKYIKKFVRVIPNDYQKVLDALAQAKKKGIALADRPLYAFNVITGQDQGHAKEVV